MRRDIETRMAFIEFPDNPCPPGAEFSTLALRDATLRVAVWPGGERGTIVVLTGRNEFVEKYFETVRRLRSRGFSVAVFDWRGQGRSSRLLRNPLKGHVADFDDYLVDLAAVMGHVTDRLDGPTALLAHSMGGHIALRALSDCQVDVRAAVLSAPMADIQINLPRDRVRWMARAATRVGLGGRWTPGRGSHELAARIFEGNTLTSDRTRFQLVNRCVKADPRLALAGPTFGWLDAAFRSIDVLNAPGTIEAIQIPVLVLSGSADVVVSNAAMQAVTRRLPQAEIITIPRARHEVLCERDSLLDQVWRAMDVFFDTTLPLAP